MKKLEILIGSRYGNYLVIGPFDRNAKGRRQVWCRCDCGAERLVDVCQLVHSPTKYCNACKGARMQKHKATDTRLYNIWSDMIQRTSNAKHPSYRLYGGRGIAVCEDWKTCAKFIEWALASGYTDELTLDRIDNDMGYCPENCRWATRRIQQRNRRTNRMISYKGVTKCLAEWAEDLGLNIKTLGNRLNRGWSFEDALTPVVWSNKRGRERHVL